MTLPTLIVHGGARTGALNDMDAVQFAYLAALEAGWTFLRYGGSAKDAVEAALRSLETASRPALLPQGEEMAAEAAFMEGDRLRWGAVAAVRRVRHPISVARTLVKQESLLLVGEGAERFAASQGCEFDEPGHLASHAPRPQAHPFPRASEKRAMDITTTMGCVALDATGLLVAGTSARRPEPGRGIGSGIVIGSGLYACKSGACTTSGTADVLTKTLAKTAIDLLLIPEHPQIAAQQAIKRFNDSRSSKAGCILLDRQGQMGWAHNADYMPIAYRTAAMNESVFQIQKPIEQALKLSDEFNPFHF